MKKREENKLMETTEANNDANTKKKKNEMEMKIETI